jgi:hypothetical protein
MGQAGPTGHHWQEFAHKTNTADHYFYLNCRSNVYRNLGLNLEVDSSEFYLLGNAGCAQHKMHPKLPLIIVPVTLKNFDGNVAAMAAYSQKSGNSFGQTAAMVF